MDAEYLRETVGDSLSVALAATLLANPADPVEYLAKYLIKQLAVNESVKVRQFESSLLAAADAEFEAEQAALVKKQQQQSAAQETQKLSNQQNLQNFFTAVQDSNSLFDGFFTNLAPLIDLKSLSFYAVNVEGTDPESQTLRFQAASNSDSNRDLFSSKLVRTEGKGVVFTLFDESEEAEETPEESSDETPAFVDRSLVVDAKLPTVFLPNVRVGPKASQVHFFRVPKSGSFLAVRFRWQSVLSEASFDDALEKMREREETKREEAEAKAKALEEAGEEEQPEEPEEEEEEEIDEEDEEAVAARDQRRAEREAKRAELAKIKAETPEEKEARLAREAQLQREQEHRELLAAITKQTVNQAICVDTLNTGARLPDPAVKFIHDSARLLMQSTLRIDRNRFPAELDAYQAFAEWQTARSSKTDEEKESSEEEAKEERAKVKQDLSNAGHPSSTQDVELAYTATGFASVAALEDGLAKARACMVLRGGGVEVYQAALLLTGYPREVVGDWEWRSDWMRIRENLDQTFVDLVKAYEPRDDEDAAKMAQVKTFIAAVDADRISERNAITNALLAWLKAALEVRKRVRLERKKAKERLAREEAARLEAEAEEKRRLEEEAEANQEEAEENQEEEED